MTLAGSIRWIALALLGLAVAAGISVAASQLVSQRIGLAAAPVSAGRELAPAHREQPAASEAPRGGHAQRHAGGSTPSRPATTTTTTSTTTIAPPTSTAPAPTGGAAGEGDGGPDD